MNHPPENTIILYGCPPDTASPRIPDIFPNPLPILPAPVVRELKPCTQCKRHILDGTECPFCHADSLAIGEAQKKKLEAAIADRDKRTMALHAIGALANARLAHPESLTPDTKRSFEEIRATAEAIVGKLKP